MGIATTRTGDRVLAAVGAGGNAKPEFESHDGVCNGGVLFLLPALLSQGLLKTKELYQIPATHYYGLESVLLTLAFMALARIKNPEQLKQCKPGEIGRLIGLDRTPEVRCLREKIKLLSGQNHAQELNRKLVDHWYAPNETEDRTEELFLYIDGHVRVYFGELANLPAKFVSRQKLCLNATTEYWVNDLQGLPVLMVTGELTEKLQTAIEGQIIPQLQQTILLPTPSQEPVSNESQPEQPAQSIAPGTEQPTGAVAESKEPAALPPLCTLIFDREAYDIPFFERLWDKYRIAMLTYRKNVKDNWEVNCFENIEVTVLEQKITMNLCEKKVTLGGVPFREIRRLTESGHQTAIITNNQQITTEQAAGRMFGRWCQENFFRYMIADYDFDKMIEYGVQAIDEKKEVINPQYRKLNHQLKKQKEKTVRLEAKLLEIVETAMATPVDQLPKTRIKECDLIEKINASRSKHKDLFNEREGVTRKITLKDMPGQQRYNQLKPESKMLMNIIKMICYRAETAIANLLSEYGVSEAEKRMVVKQIIDNNADILPDTENNTLTITLHSLSAPRFNKAAQKLAQLLTSTDTFFPNTKMKMIFKTTAL